MKYFIDTEFIEGFHKPLFGRRRHFIDLISIGIVCEDGREYYAISNEFNSKDADQWVKDNVIAKLPERYVDFHDSPRLKQEALLWKSNKRIADEIIQFVNHPKPTVLDNPEFYAYYADYDWVVFCSLFGRMIDLPAGFPMYCKDLKQMLDEKSKYWIGKSTLERTQCMGTDITKDIVDIKSHPNYPKKENEHSALDDAKWNFELYKFLTR